MTLTKEDNLTGEFMKQQQQPETWDCVQVVVNSLPSDFLYFYVPLDSTGCCHFQS